MSRNSFSICAEYDGQMAPEYPTLNLIPKNIQNRSIAHFLSVFVDIESSQNPSNFLVYERRSNFGAKFSAHRLLRLKPRHIYGPVRDSRWRVWPNMLSIWPISNQIATLLHEPLTKMNAYEIAFFMIIYWGSCCYFTLVLI